MTSEPRNPCVRNCCLDDNDICIGCGRTLDEILQWHKSTPAEQQAIIERARLRAPEAGSPFFWQNPPAADQP